MRIAVLNGPNLNRLGLREPKIYGSRTLADLEALIKAEGDRLGAHVECFQSNHEGALVDKLHFLADAGCDGVILNAGAYTHTSIALRDAIAATGLKVVEVHVSNVHAREEFRHHSHLAAVCAGVICGLGFESYLAALRYLVKPA